MIEKISISNLAWKTDDSYKALNWLKKLGIKYVEISPSKIPGFNSLCDLEFAKNYKDYLNHNFNIKVCSVQSIMFDTLLDIFNSQSKDLVLQHFDKVFKFAKALGSDVVVLGSPKNRRLNSNQTIDDTVDIITEICSQSYMNGINLALEANPVIYETNFINNNLDALNYIKDSKLKNLFINLDLGSLKVNNEKLENFDQIFFELVRHIHISEPYLEKIQFDSHLTHSLELLEKLVINSHYSIETKELRFKEFKIMVSEFIHLLSKIGTN